MIALACVILVGFGFGLGCIAIRLYDRSRKPDGLPCPHPMCRNLLPRQGSWDLQRGEWAVEDCSVCGGAVHFRGWHNSSHVIHPEDKYIRIHRPELKS